MKALSEEEMARLAFKMISGVKESFPHSEVPRRVRARCRELYSMLYYSGILSTITFAYARAKDEERVKRAFNWVSDFLEGKESPPPPAKDEEEVSYAIYAACICYLLEIMGLKTQDGSLTGVIEVLTSNSGDTLIIEDHTLRFARWLKMYAEALLGEV